VGGGDLFGLRLLGLGLVGQEEPGAPGDEHEDGDDPDDAVASKGKHDGSS
jgi:hypothetical protein